MTNTETLIDRWRELMAKRLATQRCEPRPCAALAFLCLVRPQQGLVPLRRVTVVVVHDVSLPRRVVPKLRLAGYGARVTQKGLVWGGPHAHRFEKNLSLCPRDGAGGPRLSLRQTELVDIGIRLARRLAYAQRYPAYPCREVPDLPRVWAGFCDDGRVGPRQLRIFGRQHAGGLSNEQLFSATVRRYQGLLLLPFAWVSHLYRHVVEYFAELRYSAARQTIRISGAPYSSLVGHSSGTGFDLWASRFGGRSSQRKDNTDRSAFRRLAVA